MSRNHYSDSDGCTSKEGGHNCNARDITGHANSYPVIIPPDTGGSFGFLLDKREENLGDKTKT